MRLANPKLCSSVTFNIHIHQLFMYHDVEHAESRKCIASRRESGKIDSYKRRKRNIYLEKLKVYGKRKLEIEAQ